MPGRVKGANSDYKNVNGAVKEVDAQEKASHLFLEVFVCPGEQPSRVEPNNGTFCDGLTTTCPTKTPGHARLYLSREEGASLKTDKAGIAADQAGAIRLDAATTFTVQVGGASIVVTGQGITVNGNLSVNGSLNVTGNLNVGGRITGNGALTDAYKQALDKLIAASHF